MIIAPQGRTMLGEARAQNLAFALWRRPLKNEFEAMISCGGLNKKPVFSDAAEQEAQPYFAMTPFVALDGNICTAIAADILIKGEQIRFFDGNVYRDKPTTKIQRVLANAKALAPVQAGSIPTSPVQTGRDNYEALVQKAIDKINSGACQKIVLSRVEAHDLPDDYDLLDYVEKLAQAYPSAFVALVSSEETGTWLVATPEVLLSVNDETIETMALAGTQWPDPQTDIDALTWPQKIIEEQALVADYVREAFKKCGVENLHETAAHTVRAADLYHLRSEFSASMKDLKSGMVEKMLDVLHPTPAVSGVPRPEAMQFLNEHEGYDRSFYTGYLGPVNFDGRTDLYVNLRSAQLSDRQIFLHIGGGIVAGSEPATEWEETVQKTATISKVL